MSGKFNFPGFDPVDINAQTTYPQNITLKKGDNPKFYYSTSSQTLGAAVTSLNNSFFRCTLNQPIKIFKVAVGAYCVTSAGANRLIDNLTVTLAILGGDRWPTVSVIPATYSGSGSGISNQTIIFSSSPQYGPAILDGPLYLTNGIQWQFTCMTYANFATSDTVTFYGYIMWDTM